ncbi:hypothetical protein [Kutzneria buriramensis]|uniref:DUF4386 family protein n=1 Tax=Kutzneria buriramensis TaxID=1045776 RepID=A0A3E0GUB9_9PSEU|nr:hypothetical protein [Kutzneria buriramensis]REH27674.1 hypothetical protein BCF44_12962 [Kutzneria buriramensis]
MDPARLIRTVLAAAVVGGPLAACVGGLLSPAIHENGAVSIARNAAADPLGNGTHLAMFALASFLLPLSAVGLAWLAYPRTPWLATIGGLLAVLGWLPYSALTALDDLADQMAHLPNAASYAALYDRFSVDPVMNPLLVVYIVGHLVAYVLLGIALLSADAVPRWSAWGLIVSSPLTIATFVLPGRPIAVGLAAITLIAVASVPAAWALGRPVTARSLPSPV